MKKQTFLQGAFILTMAGLISKMLGAVYRIPFARIVGEEGMGLYQMAYPIYTMILAITATGIPIAVSILIAERSSLKDRAGAERVFFVSLGILAVFGLLSSYMLAAGAHFLAGSVLKDQRAALSIIGIAPALFFTSVLGAFRGYYQGLQSMTPTAVSQVLEQVVRVITVLVAAQYLVSYGIEYSAAGAASGAATGAFAGLVFMVLLFFFFRRRQPGWRKKASVEPVPQLVKKIFYLALPISLEALVVPVMNTLDAILVPDRLQYMGLSVQEATGMFGELSGMASTLANLPMIFTISLATSLVPAISEAWTSRNKLAVTDRLSSAIRLTGLITLPSALGFMALAGPIGFLLFNNYDVGVPLFYLAPGIVFVGLYQISGAALQGLSRTAIPVVNMFLGALLKVFLNYFLIPMPGMGIKGAALATSAAFLLAAVLNFMALRKLLGYRPRWVGLLLKPILAATIMAACVVKVYQHLSGLWPGGLLPTLMGVLTGMVVYVLVLVMIGELSREDVARIPMLNRLASFLPFWANKGITR